MAHIVIHFCTTSGWHRLEGDVSRAEIDACYALPRTSCRAAYWGRVLGVNIPAGRALIWEIA